MKIAIKKKYVAGIAGFICITLGLLFLQMLLVQLSQRDLFALILPLIFLVSTIYTINYVVNLRSIEKLTDKVSKQVSNYDLNKAAEVKKDLWDKSFEESYTLNILKGKIKFTSSWVKQNEIEKTLTQKPQSKQEVKLSGKSKNKQELREHVELTSNIMLKSQNREMLRKYGKK